MLETAEVGHALKKATYERAEPKLREALLDAQFTLKDSGRGPVLVLMAGLAGGGRSETLHKLTGWMDPRFIRAMAFGPRTPEELAHPPAWRFWQALPPQGRLGIFMNAWYSEALERYRRDGDRSALRASLGRIREHEQMLADEGFRLVKVWLHMRKADLKAKLEKLEDDDDTPRPLLREIRETYRTYVERRELFEHVLRESSSGFAPWSIVEGADDHYRDLTIGRLVLAGLKAAAKGVPAAHRAAPTVTPGDVKLLRSLDLTQRLDDSVYEDALDHYQGRLASLTLRKRFAKRSLVLVFEGVDAAGKGGAVRRVTGALDARTYQVVPVSAPNDEERAHPYLWRFWRCVPRAGGITIFDRSWYGRVLVERVEGYAVQADWLRAYDEINHFEEDLVEAGAIVVKFWLQISRDEQLRRFRAREKTRFKHFKISAEDWRNRRKWPLYEQAVCDMVARTSTAVAPWTLVEGEDKKFARIKVLRTIVDRLEGELQKD
jgi:AMP-polyphosphate phosphotransferase